MTLSTVIAQVGLLLAEAGAEGHAASPPLQFRVDTSIFTLVIFVILLAVLYKLGWTPIMEGLEKREKKIFDSVENARIAQQKAEQAETDYQQKVDEGTREASQIIAQAKKEAEALKQHSLEETSAEQQRIKERAIAEINAAKDQAVRELAQKSVDSAIGLAGNLVKKEIDKKAHSKLIDESLDRFVSSS